MGSRRRSRSPSRSHSRRQRRRRDDDRTHTSSSSRRQHQSSRRRTRSNSRSRSRSYEKDRHRDRDDRNGRSHASASTGAEMNGVQQPTTPSVIASAPVVAVAPLAQQPVVPTVIVPQPSTTQQPQLVQTQPPLHVPVPSTVVAAPSPVVAAPSPVTAPSPIIEASTPAPVPSPPIVAARVAPKAIPMKFIKKTNMRTKVNFKKKAKAVLAAKPSEPADAAMPIAESPTKAAATTAAQSGKDRATKETENPADVGVAPNTVDQQVDEEDVEDSEEPPQAKTITYAELMASIAGNDDKQDGDDKGEGDSKDGDMEMVDAKTSPTNDDDNEDEEEKKRAEEYTVFMAAIRKKREEEKLKEEASIIEAKRLAQIERAKGTDRRRKRGVLVDASGETEYDVTAEQDDGPSALEQLKESMRKKDLKAVDHDTMDYAPYRRELYTEAPILASRTKEETAKIREELEIKTRGKNVPTPLDTWTQAGLSGRVIAVMKHHNWLAPFAIQRQALPAIMSGRDVIGVAKTGSGKTLAFVLPMLRHVLDQEAARQCLQEGPIALLMAPARELAVQIFKEVKKFCKATGLRAVCAYGGAGIKDQIAQLKNGCEVLVATPGRLIELLCINGGRLINLSRVTFVVMDEADRMFDLGFEPQIMRIINNTRPDRQTVLFSATFPVQVERLAKSVLRHNPIEIVVGGRTKASGSIRQLVEVREEKDKFERLLQLLGIWSEKGNILVFVDTQQHCDQLFQDLMKAGYSCLSLHGGKDQSDRDFTIQDFKQKRRTLMVATSVAGRGLDVPDLVLVINFHCPNHIEDYIHRIGRTGRAGKKGTAYTFLTPAEDKYAPDLVKAIAGANQKIPKQLQDMHDEFMGKLRRGEEKFRSSGYRGSGFTFKDDEKVGMSLQLDILKKSAQVAAGARVEPGSEIMGVGEVVDTGDKWGTALVPVASGYVDPTAPVSENPVQALLTKMGKNLEKEAIKKTGSNVVEYEIVINDYPQHARWKVNQKEMVERIQAYSNCAITSKGEYVQPGRSVSAGQRKLYLLIEGDTEYDVRKCANEVNRVLEEATREVKNDQGMARSGKYKVV